MPWPECTCRYHVMCSSDGDEGSQDEEDDACHDRGDHEGADSEEMDSAVACPSGECSQRDTGATLGW